MSRSFLFRIWNAWCDRGTFIDLDIPPKTPFGKEGGGSETPNHVKTYLELPEQHAQKALTSTYLTISTRKINVKLENLGCWGINIVGNESVGKGILFLEISITLGRELFLVCVFPQTFKTIGWPRRLSLRTFRNLLDKMSIPGSSYVNFASFFYKSRTLKSTSDYVHIKIVALIYSWVNMMVLLVL